MSVSGTVGILALQGGFEAHARKLAALGANLREVRSANELAGISALVLPGGESTTMMLGIEREGLAAPLAQLIERGLPIFATCAGTIILDDQHLDLLDITCRRNAYGRQIQSFEADIDVAGVTATDNDAFRGVFIRAPRIERVGDEVEVISTFEGQPVAVRSGGITACVFHPELTDDLRLHDAFLQQLPPGNVSDINKRKRRAA